ncbi:MAG: hypothetical protein HY705_08370, partial [Gemmatimonadetes bacterium]|nr:hypothetical protein [Gemmatimonadota bacterium]
IPTHEFAESTFPFFNSATQALAKLTLTRDEYLQLVNPFYRNRKAVFAELIARLLRSEAFRPLADLHSGRMRLERDLVPLARQLGIAAANGSLTV